MTEDSAHVKVGAKHERKRVLLLASACSPYKGSEPGVGWHRVVDIVRHFDAWVICKKKFEEDIKLYFAKNEEIPGLHFCFVPQTRFEKFIKTIPGLLYVAFNLWHRRAYRLAVELDRKQYFELVHQVNMCGFREPGYLWKIDVPFIWGPVGGTQNYPLRFLLQAGIAGAIKEATRNIFNVIQLRFKPRVRKAARKAAVLLTGNSTGQNDFRRVHKVNPVLICDVGLTTIKKKIFTDDDVLRPLRILWCGEFKHNKSLQLLLLALAKVPQDCRYKLKILGRGPLEKKWRRLARRIGIEPFCEWIAWLPKREDVMREYEWTDIFVFTSLRDLTGTVVMEAISRGVPVICFDHQGVGDVVTERCGIKLSVTTPKRAILELKDSIVSIAQDRKKLETLSEGAIDRAADYLWSRSGDKIANLYKKVLVEHHKKTKSKLIG